MTGHDPLITSLNQNYRHYLVKALFAVISLLVKFTLIRVKNLTSRYTLYVITDFLPSSRLAALPQATTYNRYFYSMLRPHSHRWRSAPVKTH